LSKKQEEGIILKISTNI